MAWNISGSVGRRAHNLRADVETVQTLLTALAQNESNPLFDPQGIDGEIKSPPSQSTTVRAIEAFQRTFLAEPDGRVDVGGRTWGRLVERAPVSPLPTPASPYFPFPVLPSAMWKWTAGARRFGADRTMKDGRKRAHAGCDLYFPEGTWIHAVADGVVTEAPSPFYAKTEALAVDHGDFLIRYGEVRPGLALRVGTPVEAGQRLAQVGRLVGITVPSPMLHMEVYDKSAQGPLTVGDARGSARRADGTPFYRRKDLVDPTPLLNVWALNLPAAR